MTCEVVVANRLGIALAADSAVTFTNGSSEQTTYASGANKIFQAAGDEPVAVMVYNSAALNQIPWEVMLKAYRRELGATSFASLHEYAVDLIDYLNNRAPVLLPDEVRQASSNVAVQSGVIYVLRELFNRRPVLSQQGADPVELRTAWDDVFAEFSGELAAEAIDPTLDEKDVAPLEAALLGPLAALVPSLANNEFPHLAAFVDAAQLIRLGMRATFCRPRQVLPNYTGVVVAGFGSQDFMPGYRHLRVFGFVGKRVFWIDQGGDAVNYTDKASLIEPFARKSMVETFTQGASPEVWKAVRSAFVEHAARVVRAAASSSSVAVLDEHVDAAVAGELDEFTNTWAVAVFRAHLGPLRSVISGLNIEEIAELAETLVMLESLKEKVTSRTQGVGGPIDVAVITKSEGLVWIKRKHYFNPELNKRYLLRLQRGV